MKKVILGVLVLVVGLVAWLYSSKTEQSIASSDKPIIKIGVVLPLTGNLSNIGQSLKNAAMLAMQDLELRGLKNKYDLVIDDDRFEPRLDATIFNKQKSIDKVDAMISFATTTGSVIAPRAQEAGIVYMNIGASDANVAKGKYNFIHWTMPGDTTRKMLEYQKKKGFKKVAFMAGNDAGVLVLQKEFLRQAPEFGIDVKVFSFNPDEKDFRMLLAKAEEYDPDVYTALIWGGNVNPFIKQFKEANINKPLTGIESVSMIEDPSSVEGMYYTDISVANENFYKHLAEKFPSTPLEYATGNMYDVITIIVEAFEKAPTKEQAVGEIIKMKTFKGVTGKTIQNEIGIFQSPAIIKKVIDGKPVVIEE